MLGSLPGRWIPGLAIRASSVVGFNPGRAAAPSLPRMRHARQLQGLENVPPFDIRHRHAPDCRSFCSDRLRSRALAKSCAASRRR